MRRSPSLRRDESSCAVATPPPPLDRKSAGVEEQLRQLSSQFETLKAQVRQAQQLATLGTAAATMAHEVNNLLTPMLAYVDAALGCDDAELMKKALSVVSKNARILVGMSERVLEIGAARPPKRESVQVRRVVDAALAGLCRDLGKDGIDVVIEVGDDAMALCDALQLQQVLFNLFLNAREAMVASHGGVLKVTSANQTHGQITLEVKNTGAPMPPDVLPVLFEPFQSSKPPTRDGKARCGGLGLALCRDLIEENDGEISAFNDLHGTTFQIVLPVTNSRD